MGGTLREQLVDGLAVALRGATVRAGASVAGAAVKAPHGVDWGQVLTTGGIWAGIVGAIAAVIAIVPMTRNGVATAWHAMLMAAGLPYNRYARKFIEKYGTYDNPYLRVRERRDLRTTYVPLSFQSDDAQNVALATDVLASLPADRLIIVGDPGSGKSTLLHAYGVKASENRFPLRHRARTVPYLISLRDLATFLNGERGVADFITDKILNGYGVFTEDRAAEFFLRTLDRQQAVVMLDGLDEVPDDRQQAVLSAVIAFMSDGRPECPTERAKIILTCRTQNFELLRENWIAALDARDSLFVLAPLRDSEIISYLLKFKSLFKTVDGPARFMRSVRESKTLDLLRAPLVLAIALGLYADRPTLIPSTVSELYRRMIEELLDRHAFRHERRPDESLLKFRRNDKYRLLREFALNAAQESGNFADFTHAEMERFASDLAPSLDDVRDGKAMVAEVIRHSGLFSDAGHDGLWHYAHRSIQEFLAAEDLQERDGDTFLLGKADDLNWRQAIQFYTAGREARKADEFLRQLAKRNSELAAHCLQAARPSDEAGRVVVDALTPVTGTTLAALAAASRSPRASIRAMAVSRLAGDIAHSADALIPSSASADDLLPLLETIADANAAEIAALVPRIIGSLPDDPRLVGPLWQCLNAEGMERRTTESGEIVRRLLTMAVEPNAFAELERQDPHDWDFLTSLRSTAYPFSRGLPAEHNLVTLLAWAEYLQITYPTSNAFFKAKAHGRLARLESDRRKTVSVKLWVPSIIVTAIAACTALGVTVTLLAVHPGRLIQPFGWWTVAIEAGVAAVGFLPGPIIGTSDLFKEMCAPDGSSSGNAFMVYAASVSQRYNDGVLNGLCVTVTILLLFALSAGFALAPISLLKSDIAVYVVLSIGAQTLFWSTQLKFFMPGYRIYLHKPNPYVDAYDDPSSKHWLVPGGGPGL